MYFPLFERAGEENLVIIEDKSEERIRREKIKLYI